MSYKWIDLYNEYYYYVHIKQYKLHYINTKQPNVQITYNKLITLP